MPTWLSNKTTPFVKYQRQRYTAWKSYTKTRCSRNDAFALASTMMSTVFCSLSHWKPCFNCVTFVRTFRAPTDRPVYCFLQRNIQHSHQYTDTTHCTVRRFKRYLCTCTEAIGRDQGCFGYRTLRQPTCLTAEVSVHRCFDVNRRYRPI